MEMEINQSSMNYHDLPPAYFWRFLVIGYLLTIAIETPILVAGLARGHSLARRLLAGVWLTACTYPIVVLVLPLVVPPWFADPQHGEWVYLAVAETFAPLAECALFSMLIKQRTTEAIIVAPNPKDPFVADAGATTSAKAQRAIDGNPYQSPQSELHAVREGPRVTPAGMPQQSNHATWQDYLAIIAANLASFLGGEWLLKNVAWLRKLIAID